MKIGRIILTFREDLIPELKEYYLDSGRSDFLVIAYNVDTVDPKKFKGQKNFHLMPYFKGVQSLGGRGIQGQQFRVWANVAKEFPEIDHWVSHDYDLVCKPTDKQIFANVPDDSYMMIGKPIPVWQEGMKDSGVDMYPFPQKQKDWHKAPDAMSQSVDRLVDSILMDNYPFYHQGIKTILGGFGDFIATASKNMLLLNDPSIKNITAGGTEQVPQTIFAANNIKSIDARSFYKTKILMDYTYLDINSPYDFLNPVKYWPKSLQPTFKIKYKNKLKKLRNFIIGMFPSKK